MNQQRTMSNSSGLVLPGPFMRLPVELLEEIYILSETHSLPHVCRSFYIALNSDFTRLRFCTRLFYLGNARNNPGPNAVHLRDEQTKIFARDWFTVDFLQRLVAAVNYMRSSDGMEDDVRSKLSPTTYSDTKSNTQTDLSLYVSGAHLPAPPLRGIWSQSKLELVRQLLFWGPRKNSLDKLRV